jgi:hypothetical protein
MSGGPVKSHAESMLMSAGRSAGLIFVFLTAGCAGLEHAAPASVSTQTGAAAPAAAAIEPLAPPATANREAPQADAAESAADAVKPVLAPVAPSLPPSTAHPAAKGDAPAARTPAKLAAAPEPAAQAPTQESVAPAVVKPAAPPPLDLKSLQTRLKETKAIGVFTKLALKNQVDDLLDHFRAFYQGRIKTTLAELRQPYDMLLLKVLALLQDADPPLAGAIAASREAIWGILADPSKFATL